MQKFTIVQAINQAIAQEMELDPTVVVLGEDVGRDGGVFRVTEGLIEKFGEERVIDTPLAEAGIAGTAIGMAVFGLKPIAEFQFDGFSLPALDQLINHAARLRWRSRGRFHVPAVFRFPYGGGIKALEHHSDSPETHYAHTPGLKVVIPSDPYDAKGLMTGAIRDPDPVIFMEPKRIYRAFKQDVPEEQYAVPLGEARIVREGTDLTLVGYGAMVRIMAEAADKLLAENINTEVIDLRTISPWDEKTVIDSVKKTGRCVIVHEAQKQLGMGSEISATINEKALLSLQAPVERVTGYDIIPPLPRNERYYFFDSGRVVNACKRVMSY